ncbi:MAG: RNA-binding protein [Candidatus Hydrogenedentes bacterium]|nr:RNA-binding protein [Candidatus Hydrogenedentota bacterium]
MNIYVGNLSFDSGAEDIRELFSAHGQVDDVRVISDRETGRSKGFGFVEMPNDSEARSAINQLNGTDLHGRNLTVNEARPREERSPRRGSGRY